MIVSPKICNVCENELENPLFSSNLKNSLTSHGKIIKGKTDVYYCHNCTHIQTKELADINEFYDKNYRLLIRSDEEDQVYNVDNNEKIFRYDHQVKTLINLVKLPEQANILDYGCGKATTIKKFAEIKTNITPFVFDVSDIYVPFWKKFIKNTNMATYEINVNWFNKMDLVTSFFSLEHVNSPLKMLKNIYKLLKPNGFFYCIVPDITKNIADFIVIDHINHFTEYSLSKL